MNLESSPAIFATPKLSEAVLCQPLNISSKGITAAGRQPVWMNPDGTPYIPTEQSRGYGPGKPMYKDLVQAKGAGEGARAIWDQGMEQRVPLPTDRPATADEARRNCCLFLQIFSGDEVVATISQGLPWDQETPVEECLAEMINNITGGQAELTGFGPHTVMASMNEQIPVQEMLKRFANAPIDPYRKYLPNLADAVEEIQRERLTELTRHGGYGYNFAKRRNQEMEALVPAFREDGLDMFEFAYLKQGEGYIALPPDNDKQPMKMVGLGRDTDMSRLLEEVQNAHMGAKSDNQWTVLGYFGPSVPCCGNATRAKIISITKKHNQVLPGVGLMSVSFKDRSSEYCNDCREQKVDGECSCSKIKGRVVGL